MNNRKSAIKEIKNFIESDTEKVAVIKGTNQYEKHSLILEIISNEEEFKTGLFRSNSLQNVGMQLEHAGYNIKSSTKFQSGKEYTIRNKTKIYFDSLNSSRTWGNSPCQLDFIIVYPIDPLCRMKKY